MDRLGPNLYHEIYKHHRCYYWRVAEDRWEYECYRAQRLVYEGKSRSLDAAQRAVRAKTRRHPELRIVGE